MKLFNVSHRSSGVRYSTSTPMSSITIPPSVQSIGYIGVQRWVRLDCIANDEASLDSTASTIDGLGLLLLAVVDGDD